MAIIGNVNNSKFLRPKVSIVQIAGYLVSAVQYCGEQEYPTRAKMVLTRPNPKLAKRLCWTEYPASAKIVEL
jgi:hypothetical protein